MERRVLDGIINRLLEVRGRPGKQVQLSEGEIKQLCMVSRDIFLKQPNLLELEAPIKICGNYFFSTSCIIFYFDFKIIRFFLVNLCTWPCFSIIDLIYRKNRETNNLSSSANCVYVFDNRASNISFSIMQ
jgi:hypothetical protein